MDSLFLQLKFILITFSISSICLLICWMYDYFQFQYPYDKTKDKLPFRLVAVSFALFLGIAVIIIPGITYAWLSYLHGGFPSAKDFEITNVQQGWGNVLSIGFTFFALIVYLIRRSGPSFFKIFGENFFKIRCWPKDIALGIGTWFICIPLVATVDGVIQLFIKYFFAKDPVEQVAVQQLKLSVQDPLLYTLTILCVVIVVPIMEEILFRGILLSWIRTFVGRGWSITISAFIFACFHFSSNQGITNIQIILDLFVLSCFLGFIYERQQSLLSPIFLHITFNAVSVIRLFSDY
ncbi:MAG: CPBP family intramembrane glutamic endopeptidase [Chlamydiota bacterium]|nr:CPBP family intramembrane glutamic endopeptidase [Chlamydiota bacterium]